MATCSKVLVFCPSLIYGVTWGRRYFLTSRPVTQNLQPPVYCVCKLCTSFLYTRPGARSCDSLLNRPRPAGVQAGPSQPPVTRPGTRPGGSLTLDESASTRGVRVPRARGHPTPPYARVDHPPARKPMGPPRRHTVPEQRQGGPGLRGLGRPLRFSRASPRRLGEAQRFASPPGFPGLGVQFRA